MARYAAIDIGSNSIRMQVAEAAPGAPARILAAERQVTRLGESVFRNGIISPEAMEFACGILARFAEQYKSLDVVGVRAVATAALRDTSNPADFLARASAAAGTPVEIISGREEARLIHLGVESRWSHPNKRILIIDIGGGSAEIICAAHGSMRDAVSKPLGAVRLHSIFVQNDPPGERELHQMQEYVEERLAGLVRRFGPSGWDRVVATSATASAVVCAVNRVPRAKRDQADRMRASTPQVRRLFEKIRTLDVAGRRRITGIGPSRAEIIIPGAGVLLQILEEFQVPSVYFSLAGVRDGIVADLAARGVGRELSQLSRDQRREVEQMSRKYAVSHDHARKVAEVAHALFAALQPLHGLPAWTGKVLEAAAFLHDVGHFVSDASHHKHSYYLVANSDLPGFTARERELIANLCRYHRKAMPAPAHLPYQALAVEEKRILLLLAPILRLADNLDRGHAQRIESLDCQLKDGQLLLRVEAAEDIDLEQWAAERAGEFFRQVYGKPVVVVKARPQ